MLTDQLSTEARGVLLQAAGAAAGDHVRRPLRLEVDQDWIDVRLDGLTARRDLVARRADRDRRRGAEPPLRRRVAELRRLAGQLPGPARPRPGRPDHAPADRPARSGPGPVWRCSASCSPPSHTTCERLA
ncbi:hypothetical protein ACWGID_12595 [Kribbella sp. NPDC054772]